MPYTKAETFKRPFWTDSESFAEGGKLKFYRAGTTTETEVYSDDSGTSLGVEITLNARGEPDTEIFLDSAVRYKIRLFVIQDGVEVQKWEEDNIRPESRFTTGTDPTDILTVDDANSLGFDRQVDSVSALRSGSYPSSLKRIWLRGYYSGSPGVGGGALYRSSGTDNGVTVYVDADGVAWERIVDGLLYVEEAGAKGDGTTDDAQAFEDALSVANSDGIGIVRCAGPNVYAHDPSTTIIQLRSNTILDLNGGTLKRIGTDTTTKSVQNANPGTTASDTNLGIINGKITGTGSTEGVSDQGSALTLFGVDGFIIENLETDDTNGDGIQWREAHNGFVRHVRIGDFGRNGWSPTSGQNVTVVDLEVSGDALTGANPGKAIDAETNSAGESGVYTFINVVARDCTIVDLQSSASADFLYELSFIGCDFGPAFQALRIKSTNNTNAKRVFVDPSTHLRSGTDGTNSYALTVDNVNGVQCHVSRVQEATGTSNKRGVQIINAVDRLTLDGLICDDGIDDGLWGFDGTLTNALIRDSKLENIFLIGDSNKFENCDIGQLRFDGAGTINNVIEATCRINSFSATDGASVGSQINKSPFVSDLDILTWHEVDRQTVASGSYATIFDLSSVTELLGGAIMGRAVGFRLTVDGTVIANRTAFVAGVDSGGADQISTLVIPYAKAASSIKLEAYNAAGASNDIGWRVVTR